MQSEVKCLVLWPSKVSTVGSEQGFKALGQLRPTAGQESRSCLPTTFVQSDNSPSSAEPSGNKTENVGWPTPACWRGHPPSSLRAALETLPGKASVGVCEFGGVCFLDLTEWDGAVCQPWRGWVDPVMWRRTITLTRINAETADR